MPWIDNLFIFYSLFCFKFQFLIRISLIPPSHHHYSQFVSHSTRWCDLRFEWRRHCVLLRTKEVVEFQKVFCLFLDALSDGQYCYWLLVSFFFVSKEMLSSTKAWEMRFYQINFFLILAFPARGHRTWKSFQNKKFITISSKV
jgi:hypothetical protein